MHTGEEGVEGKGGPGGLVEASRYTSLVSSAVIPLEPSGPLDKLLTWIKSFVGQRREINCT